MHVDTGQSSRENELAQMAGIMGGANSRFTGLVAFCRFCDLEENRPNKIALIDSTIRKCSSFKVRNRNKDKYVHVEDVNN